MIGEDVLYLTVRELGERIRTKKLSPVELATAYLKRSESIGPKLNAYATIMPERVLTEAREAEKEIAAGKYRGPLHGIPYAAKDLLAAKGAPTTWGARPFANQTFDFDANVIKRLRDAGAVLIGKAAMIELAGGMGYRFGTASISGGAKNPWNETCWTCGSSSGSGAIVAAGLAAFAIGTETWGSIVCPSAYCGVSGLRPTFGRVGRSGAMALSYTMDKIGPMARSADDCGLILRALAAHDANDKGSLSQSQAEFHYAPHPASGHPLPTGRGEGLGVRGLRIGVLTNAWKDVDPEIQKLTDGVFNTMKLAGAHIENATLPDGPWEAAAGVTISVEGASAFESLIESGRVAELTDPLGKIGGYINMTIPGTDYARAQRLRGIVQRKIDALFESFDVIAAASLPIAATSMETNLETDLAFADPLGGIGNFCGLPAISVPSGFTSKGLPAGIQFVGRVLDDDKVLAAASLFQSHTTWHRRRPAL
jgi:aspartyl-tRNA(Asn)/glutamyl-tRNA(Gln) amidotransferase subunit A